MNNEKANIMNEQEIKPGHEVCPLDAIVNYPMVFRVWDNEDYMSSHFTLQDIQEGKIKFTSDCKVMQFSGVTDKNGNKIFSGDICKHYSRFLHPKEDVKELEEFETTEIGTIEYRGGAFGFVRNDRKSSMWGVLDADDEDIAFGMEEYWFEVIGNVFENPELLQKGS